MSVFDILGGVGATAGDIFILLSILGAVLVLAWRAANLLTTRRHRAPELIVWWAILGWLLGVICLASFVIAGYTQSFGKFFVELTVAGAAGLLLLALLLMVAARLLDGLGERRRQVGRAVRTRQRV